MSETPEGSAEQPEWQNDAPHSAWGDPISPERRAELQEMFERQKQWEEQKDHDPGQSVFNGERLTGAEVFWLAAMALREEEGDLDRAAAKLRMEDGYFDLSGLHLEGVNLREAELQHAHLNGAHLDGANLDWVQLQRATLNGAQLNYAHLVQAHLDGAILRQAHLDGANLHLAVFQDADLTEAHVQHAKLSGANLTNAHLAGARLEGTGLTRACLQKATLSGAQLRGADLVEAWLEHADFEWAQMQGANLFGAQLQHANLRKAQLQQVDLTEAQLQHANLTEAQLEGATLFQAQLEGASLIGASFDKTSHLNKAKLDGVSLDQVIFDNTNLTIISWETVKRLGDEQTARGKRPQKHWMSPLDWKAEQYHAAARAYRSLSVALRNQGLGTDSTRFHYRAELMERKSSWWQIFARLRSRRFYTAPEFFGRWLSSWLLGTFSGYGDYFGRLLLTYLLVVSGFAGLMFLVSSRAFSFDAIRDTFVLSITSFHGRGVQPPGLTITDTLATLTAVEAFFGLFIEGIFIAAFTRRVTGN